MEKYILRCLWNILAITLPQKIYFDNIEETGRYLDLKFTNN